MNSRESLSAPLVDAAAAAAARLRNWLLTGPAQLRSGSEAGGIAGSIDVDGKPRYVYAEITGYYLSWLADIADRSNGTDASENARLALDWSTRAFGRAGQLPHTRIYLEPATPDWRNDAIFFFDLAMLVHGIDAATEAKLISDPAALRSALHAHLEQFVDGETLRAAVQIRGTKALPPRWSTLGGPFLVKATSRVIHGAFHARPSAALARACLRDSDQWASRAAAIDLGMLHPTFYFAEGLLLSRPDCADAIGTLLRRSLDLTLADGSLPETADDAEPKVAQRVRNDIIAQALRLAVLLRELGAQGAPTLADIDRLAASLLSRIDGREFVSFNDESNAQPNVWCSMFAEQALRWYADVRTDDISAKSARRPSAAALV